jgi:ABC-type multidrug transport system fused ATPase/permease subunit
MEKFLLLCSLDKKETCTPITLFTFVCITSLVHFFIHFLPFATTCFRSLGQASPCMSAFAAGKAAAYKMFETIKRKPEIDAYDMKGEILDDIHGDIEMRNIDFSYPARPDEKIFSGFSLYIHRGTTVALVGQSGSGKSTVISLIERFYDPQAGEVLIDGINIKDLQLKWIRGKIGLVSQEPVLFDCSIKENIAYGNDGATVEEIRAAAELANAAKFIDKLPKVLSFGPPSLEFKDVFFLITTNIVDLLSNVELLHPGTRYHGW